MTITSSTIDFPFDQQGWGFHAVNSPSTRYIQGQGWFTPRNDIAPNVTQFLIVLDHIPIKFNQRVTEASIVITMPGQVGFVWRNVCFTADGTGCPSARGGITQGVINESYGLDSGSWGDNPPIAVAINSQTIAGGGAYLVALTLTVLTDDSLTDPNANNAPAIHLSGDCIVNIEYDEGLGPSCVAPLDVFSVHDILNSGSNVIDMTFDQNVTIEFVGQVNWNVQNLQDDPYLLLYGRDGTLLNVVSTTDYSSPSATNTRYTLARIVIKGPYQTNVYQVIIKLIQVSPEGNPSGNIVNIDTSGIENELERIKTSVDNSNTDISSTITEGLANLLSGATGLPQNVINTLVNASPELIQAIIRAILQSIAPNSPIPVSLGDSLTELIQGIITLNADALSSFLQGVVSTIGLNNNDWLANANAGAGGALDEQGVVVNNLLNGSYVDFDAFISDLQSAGNATGLIITLQNIYTFIIGTFDFLKSKTEVADIVTRQLLLSEYTPNINDLATHVRAYFRNFIDRTQLDKYAGKVGLDRYSVDELLRANSAIPSLGEIRESFLKGFITRSVHDNYLGEYGISQNDIETIVKNYDIIPNISDLTRLADKHIFSPDIPVIFGQYDEMPQGYLDSMAQWGIPPDWSEKIWAAHWSLPGLQDSFSMFHRGIISQSELNTYFALTDILPFFREKLKLLNYSLITRVDIRRFYAQGVFNEAQVLDAYKKLGFDETNAALQTQYTVLHERDTENPTKIKIKALTESMVVKAYKRGIISEQEAINRLGKVGFLTEDAQLILKLETQIDNGALIADKTQHYHDKTFNHILSSFAKGTIGVDDVRNYLTMIGVPSAEIEAEINYATIERFIALKEYVETHIRNAYTSGQINKVDAINLMSTVGFNMSEITYLFEELDLVNAMRNKQLTEVQLKDIYNSGQIDYDTLLQELMNIGYNQQHAIWLAGVIAPQGG